MRLFSLDTRNPFGDKVAASLDRSVDAIEERDFEDGEHKIRPLLSVRDEDVYVIQSLYADGVQSVNDKLCKLLFFIATLKDCGARRVTAVTPYLCYARKDRKTKSRDPVTMRYVASLFEAVNTDCVVTIDVHNLQAYQNGFRCRTEHLDAHRLFVGYFQNVLRAGERVVVMSPDIGGVKRAQLFRDRLAMTLGIDVEFAFMEKWRSEGIVSGGTIVGDVNEKTVIIFDDLINSGSTIARAAAACKRLGALTVYGAATHGVFIGKSNEAFKEPSLDKIIVTNTVLSSYLDNDVKNKVVILDAALMFAEVIRRLNTSGSLVSLLEFGDPKDSRIKLTHE